LHRDAEPGDVVAAASRRARSDDGAGELRPSAAILRYARLICNQRKEGDMPGFTRVAEFEADDAAVDRFVSMINAESGPPEGVPATAITVLRSQNSGKLRVVTFFDTADDLRQGSETLDGMSPADDASMRRVSVETFEVLVQRQL
jgi:hypothetical protein